MEDVTQAALAAEVSSLLQGEEGDGPAFLHRLHALRHIIIKTGLPDAPLYLQEQQPATTGTSSAAAAAATTTTGSDVSCTGCSVRAGVWLLLLGVRRGDLPATAEVYAALVARGASRVADKITKDAQRTLRGDVHAGGGDSIAARGRLLNAFVHWADDAAAAHAAQHTQRAGDVATTSSASTAPVPAPVAVPTVLSAGYQQGMGSLAATLLYVLPEHAAFAAFKQLVVHALPGLYEAAQRGVRAGCSLADEVLRYVDPALHSRLLDVYGPASSHAELMFFSRLSSLYASRPPLQQVVRLWDAILAYGAHLCILLCAAECVCRREELMAAGRDAITRFQGIGDATGSAARLAHADQLILIALELTQHIPAALYDKLVAFSVQHAGKQQHLHTPHTATAAAPAPAAGVAAGAQASASTAATAADAPGSAEVSSPRCSSLVRSRGTGSSGGGGAGSSGGGGAGGGTAATHRIHPSRILQGLGIQEQRWRQIPMAVAASIPPAPGAQPGSTSLLPPATPTTEAAAAAAAAAASRPGAGARSRHTRTPSDSSVSSSVSSSGGSSSRSGGRSSGSRRAAVPTAAGGATGGGGCSGGGGDGQHEPSLSGSSISAMISALNGTEQQQQQLQGQQQQGGARGSSGSKTAGGGSGSLRQQLASHHSHNLGHSHQHGGGTSTTSISSGISSSGRYSASAPAVSPRRTGAGGVVLGSSGDSVVSSPGGPMYLSSPSPAPPACSPDGSSGGLATSIGTAGTGVAPPPLSLQLHALKQATAAAQQQHNDMPAAAATATTPSPGAAGFSSSNLSAAAAAARSSSASSGLGGGLSNRTGGGGSRRHPHHALTALHPLPSPAAISPEDLTHSYSHSAGPAAPSSLLPATATATATADTAAPPADAAASLPADSNGDSNGTPIQRTVSGTIHADDDGAVADGGGGAADPAGHGHGRCASAASSAGSSASASSCSSAWTAFTGASGYTGAAAAAPLGHAAAKVVAGTQFKVVAATAHRSGNGSGSGVLGLGSASASGSIPETQQLQPEPLPVQIAAVGGAAPSTAAAQPHYQQTQVQPQPQPPPASLHARRTSAGSRLSLDSLHSASPSPTATASPSPTPTHSHGSSHGSNSHGLMHSASSEHVQAAVPAPAPSTANPLAQAQAPGSTDCCGDPQSR